MKITNESPVVYLLFVLRYKILHFEPKSLSKFFGNLVTLALCLKCRRIMKGTVNFETVRGKIFIGLQPFLKLPFQVFKSNVNVSDIN